MRRGTNIRRALTAVLALGLGHVLSSACSPPNVAGDSLKGVTTGEAFEGVKCSAVRPQTEPDLMAWDPGSRSNLNRLRRQGVVAVRYEAKGCNVELELLSHCIGSTEKYAFSPYSANERKVAHNANELFAQLPVGAARLAGSVKGTRALRTDYMMAGQYALAAGSTFKLADLHGPDCARATHVVSAVYVGGFAMGAGESRSIEGGLTLFGAGGGAKSAADVEVLGDEGNAEACKASQKDGKESEQCAVPLRIGLLVLEGKPEAPNAVASKVVAGSPLAPPPAPPPPSNPIGFEIGSDEAQVARALGEIPIERKGNQLRFKTSRFVGMVFFDQNGRVETIRFDPGHPGEVEGVRLGDSSTQLLSVRGAGKRVQGAAGYITYHYASAAYGGRMLLYWLVDEKIVNIFIYNTTPP